MTEDETLMLLYKAVAAYPNQIELRDETVNVWVERLANIPLERGLKNLNTHIDSNRFFPTIADIIKYDPEQYVNYEQLRIETQKRLIALDRPTPNISEERLAEIKRRVDSGELDNKYKDDPYLGGVDE